MGRRKRQFLDDGDSDSGASEGSEADFHLNDNNADARDERALFEDPYRHKRRRRDGKEDAIYGAFGDDSDDEDYARKGGARSKKTDWTKAPAFVSGEKVELKMELEAEDEAEDEAVDEVDDEVASETVDSTDAEEEKSDGSMDEVQDEEVKEPEPSIVAPAPTRPGLGAATFSGLPSSFGATARTQRAFLRSESSSGPSSQRSTPLPVHEQAHFHKIGGTLGAQMLAKMGWKAGTGLGTGGEGIIVPIESKLRPKNAGIAYKGFKEKTEQSKLEAKRRGEVVSDDEELPPTVKKAKEAKEKRSNAWKHARKVKTKVEHKTYEQIVADAGQEPSAPSIGPIIDATGREPRELASLAEISLASWTPSTDPTRIPEVRHNLRLIATACKTDLDGLAREAKALEDRKRFIVEEDARLRRKLTAEAELISQLQQVSLVVDEISTKSRELASVYEVTLDDFSPLFSKLLQFPAEFDKYRLDEIVVAAITPTVRRIVAQWNPLVDPSTLVSTFRTWKQALKVNLAEQPSQTQVSLYGAGAVDRTPVVEQPMTPFESLLWNVWLPKVRTSINNEWDPCDCSPAIRLYETWSSFLPPFIRDNMLDQLILPKLAKAVTEWNPKRTTVSLQSLVFPWLPHLGLRVESVLDDARRKVKVMLRSWRATDGLPKDLVVWRDVFDGAEWDNLLLKYVVPKLASHFREEFRVNPRAQEMRPLTQVVLPWSPLLRGSVMSQLLEAEFFPKWLDVLYIWLIQPRVSFEEVAQWYAFWKGVFAEDILALKGVQKGFTRGLQLMNEAIEHGSDAPTKLKRADTKVEQAATVGTSKAATKSNALPSRTHEITFRSIVEEYAAEHNLLFMPTGRAHETSRMPLFRVSGPSGKGGVLVYVQDDAVWAPEGDEYRAITLEEMVVKANK
ncbi:TFP11-domain-containing protein [Boletus edulis]|nr:TFP11-domain-containing protein [Boletus edulis]